MVVHFYRLRFGSVKIRLEEIVKVILMSPHRTKHNIRLTFIGLPDVSITNLNNSKAMKNFKTNTKDAKKLLQTIKSEFMLKEITDEKSSDGMWFELIEWGEVDKYHITFYTECADRHNAFNVSKNNTCASRLTMGSIRLNYRGTHTIQMSKQVTYDDLNMKGIDL